MPIMVTFDQEGHAQNPDAKSVEFGPYLCAELSGDAIHVMDGFQPLILATRTAGVWTVNGLEGMPFAKVRFLPPAEDRTGDVDRACDQYDAEHDDD